jgi:hypothetical protein
MKPYRLKPTMTFNTVASAPAPGKSADRALTGLVNAIVPAAAQSKPAPLPPPQCTCCGKTMVLIGPLPRAPT